MSGSVIGNMVTFTVKSSLKIAVNIRRVAWHENTIACIIENNIAFTRKEGSGWISIFIHRDTAFVNSMGMVIYGVFFKWRYQIIIIIIIIIIIVSSTRWFKCDRDWLVCKQASLRSSCATLREWSHNLHPPSCSG